MKKDIVHNNKWTVTEGDFSPISNSPFIFKFFNVSDKRNYALSFASISSTSTP